MVTDARGILNPQPGLGVLVIEDDAGLNELIREVLERDGVAVEGVLTGTEALAKVQEDPDRLLLLDYDLPDMTGFELIETLHRTGHRVPFIVMTGYGDEKIAVEMMKLSARDYMVKGSAFIERLPQVIGQTLRALAAEKRLAEAEEQVRSLSRFPAEDPSPVLRIGRDGVLLYANKASGPLLASWGCGADSVVPGDWRSRIASAFAGQSPVEVEVECDGRVFSCLLAPIVEAGYVNVYGRDITRRQRAEAENARLAAAVEHAGEAIVVTDVDGAIQYVNPGFERITGYRRDEVLGKNPRILKSGKQDEVFYQDLWKTISSGCVWSGHFINVRKDGALYEEEATISPVYDASGAIVSFVGVKRDVTEQVRLERRLRQAQKLEAIGQLAAGIAHEINTPIQYVGDNTHFLQDSFEELSRLHAAYGRLLVAAKARAVTKDAVADVETVARDVDVEYLCEEIPKAITQSLDGIERVTNIVRAMKEFAHPGSAEKMSVNLNSAVESTVAVARNEWKYVADVVTDLDPDLPLVLCLPGELNQVILNLIVNAAHAIGEVVAKGDNRPKGSIRIQTRQDGDWVEIRVSDTGTGIPQAIQSRIFDPFFTTKSVGKGSGQGLAIAHSVIVEKHRGNITFETLNEDGGGSRRLGEGRGTTFIVRLPLNGGPAPNRLELTGAGLNPKTV